MNTTNLVGYLQENLGNGYRYIEVKIPSSKGENVKEMRIKHWTGGDNTYLTSLPEKTLVSLVGHLDIDPKFGQVVIAEVITCLKKP